jgi:hypothetical protein
MKPKMKWTIQACIYASLETSTAVGYDWQVNDGKTDIIWPGPLSTDNPCTGDWSRSLVIFTTGDCYNESQVLIGSQGKGTWKIFLPTIVTYVLLVTGEPVPASHV